MEGVAPAATIWARTSSSASARPLPSRKSRTSGTSSWVSRGAHALSACATPLRSAALEPGAVYASISMSTALPMLSGCFCAEQQHPRLYTMHPWMLLLRTCNSVHF